MLDRHESDVVYQTWSDVVNQTSNEAAGQTKLLGQWKTFLAEKIEMKHQANNLNGITFGNPKHAEKIESKPDVFLAN